MQQLSDGSIGKNHHYHLEDALATIDYHFDLFLRSSTVQPFLLFNGHSSRFELAFLESITDTMDGLYWVFIWNKSLASSRFVISVIKQIIRIGNMMC